MTEAKKNWSQIQAELNDLSREIAPEQDQWPLIKQRITNIQSERNHMIKSSAWGAWPITAMAACLLIAITSIVLSFQSLQKIESIQIQNSQLVEQSMGYIKQARELELIRAAFLAAVKEKQLTMDVVEYNRLVNQIADFRLQESELLETGELSENQLIRALSQLKTKELDFINSKAARFLDI